jgi:hypothetical protein
MTRRGWFWSLVAVVTGGVIGRACCGEKKPAAILPKDLTAAEGSHIQTILVAGEITFIYFRPGTASGPVWGRAGVPRDVLRMSPCVVIQLPDGSWKCVKNREAGYLGKHPGPSLVWHQLARARILNPSMS